MLTKDDLRMILKNNEQDQKQQEIDQNLDYLFAEIQHLMNRLESVNTILREFITAHRLGEDYTDAA